MLRPAWVLSLMILAGWLIGAIGTGVTICPSSYQCGPVTFYLAQTNSLVVNNNLYFQLGSSIFVTNSILDAAFNLLAVLILDRFTSPTFNFTRYFSIFFGAAIAGNLLTLLWGPDYSSAGASGGIFGLYAAVFSFYWAEDKKVDKTMLGLFLIIFLGSSFLVSNVNYLAHIGGSLFGFVAGPLLYYTLRQKLETFAPSTSSLLASRIIAGALIATFLVAVTGQFVLFATS